MRLEQWRNTPLWVRDPYEFLRRAAEREGRFSFLRDLPALGETLLTGEPEIIAQIVNHPELDAGRGIVGLRRILGSGSLIMMDGEEHKARKQIVAPSLRGPQLSRYDEMFERVTHRFIADLPDRFQAHALLQDISLRIMAHAMFGDDEALVDEACARISSFLSTFHSPILLFARPLQIDLGPLSPWGRALGRQRRLAELCRMQLDSGQGMIREIRARAPDTDPEDLVTEVLALLLFGHDTGAAAMAFALGHIHQHGHVERAIEEPAWRDATLRESMRVCPVVPHLTRVARSAVSIGGFDIPEGGRIAPAPWLAHHNPAVWSEPDTFDPGRFLSVVPDFGWFPFGFGARICVGMPFILRQMQVVLGTVLRTTRLALAPGYTLMPTRKLVLVVPKGGCPMQRR